MARSHLRRALVALVVPTVLMLGATPAGALTNQGFETGTLSDWSVLDSGSGYWMPYSGNRTPQSRTPIPAPPEGNFAAVTDQTGPGSHILYRDIQVPLGLTVNLAFHVYYENGAGSFATPATLLHTGAPNQQYRVDLIDPTAPVTTMAPAQIRRNLFATRVGDPSSMAPTLIVHDISSFAGSTIRLRFAEVDNQFAFHAGVDDVRLIAVQPTTTEAAPAVAEILPSAETYLTLSATLDSLGTPLAGQTIDFTINDRVVCTAVTTTNGRAVCGGLARVSDVLAAGSYEAVFAGTPDLMPSSDTARLLVVAGQQI